MGVPKPWPKSLLDKRLRDVLVDVSQSLDRKRYVKGHGILGALCTSTRLIHLGRRSVVFPVEYLYLQGHGRGVKVPSGVSGSAIRKLAGEGMAMPCIGLCVYCLDVIKGFPANS